MSSILDALKKSERQHSLGCDLIFRSGSPDAPPRRPRFVMAVLATLLLSAAVTGVVLFSLYEPESTQIVMLPPPVPADNKIDAVAPAVRAETVHDLKDQAAKPATRPVAALKSPIAVATPSPTPEVGGTPWLSSLPEVFRNSLPPLNVNIHVYSPNESQRILYINNRQVQQGERIQAGVLIEEIVQDGVILRFRGQRFKLPRPS